MSSLAPACRWMRKSIVVERQSTSPSRSVSNPLYAAENYQAIFRIATRHPRIRTPSLRAVWFAILSDKWNHVGEIARLLTLPGSVVWGWNFFVSIYFKWGFQFFIVTRNFLCSDRSLRNGWEINKRIRLNICKQRFSISGITLTVGTTFPVVLVSFSKIHWQPPIFYHIALHYFKKIWHKSSGLIQEWPFLLYCPLRRTYSEVLLYSF